MSKIEYVKIGDENINVSQAHPAWEKIIARKRKEGSVFVAPLEQEWVKTLMEDIKVGEEEALILLASKGALEVSSLNVKKRKEVVEYVCDNEWNYDRSFRPLPVDILEWVRCEERVSLYGWRSFKDLVEVCGGCRETATAFERNGVFYLDNGRGTVPKLRRNFNKKKILDAIFMRKTPKWFNNHSLTTIVGLRNVLREANFNYLQEGDLTVKGLLHAGVKFETIVRNQYGDNIARLLSKKELVAIGKLLAETGLEASSHYYNAFDSFKNLKGIENVFGFSKIESDHLRYEVKNRSRNLLTWKWCHRNLTNLGKTRVIRGYDGQESIYHNTSVIPFVNPDTLEGNFRMGWKKVMAKIKTQQELDIKKRAGQNLTFPDIPTQLARSLVYTPSVEYIANSHRLAKEGNDMSHCVGSYMDKCLAGRSFIFHVKDGTKEGATVEVNPPERGGSKWTIAQAMGAGNIRSVRAHAIMEKIIQVL